MYYFSTRSRIPDTNDVGNVLIVDATKKILYRVVTPEPKARPFSRNLERAGHNCVNQSTLFAGVQHRGPFFQL